MEKFIRFNSFIVLMVISVLISSCGGGGGTTSTPIVDSGDDDSNDNQSDLLNLLQISGKVVIQSSETPVPNAKVSLEGLGSTTTTNENGDYAFSIETDADEILVNASADGYSSNQQVINIDKNVRSIFVDSKLKLAKTFDSVLLASIASTGKKSKEEVEAPLAQVEVDLINESDLIPGNLRTNTLGGELIIYDLQEIHLINPDTNEPFVTDPTDLSYQLDFAFEVSNPDLDVQSLVLWCYDISKGQWKPYSDAELLLASNTEGEAKLSFQVKKTGWFAVGELVSKLACIKGRVVDSSGVTLPGVHVTIKGISFSGFKNTTTNSKGIFEAKIKAGSVVEVIAKSLGQSIDSKIVVIQNYAHNEGGVADLTYCQPAGPEEGDSFYTTHLDFKNLVPPAGYEQIDDTGALPLTLTMSLHKISGTVLYETSGGSANVPTKNKDGSSVLVTIQGVGLFPLTKDGAFEVQTKLKEPISTVVSSLYHDGTVSYFGVANVDLHSNETESKFSLLLKNDDLVEVTGVVTYNGVPSTNTEVVLTSGPSTKTDSSGKYKISFPVSKLTSGIKIFALRKNLATSFVYFSSKKAISEELKQTIDLEINEITANLKGSVCSQLGEPINNALVSVLIDKKYFAGETETGSSGEYSFTLPVNSEGSYEALITSKYVDLKTREIKTGFTKLNVSPSTDASSSDNYTADKILLDLSSTSTSIKGVVLINGSPQKDVVVVGTSQKVITDSNGSFSFHVSPGEGKLSFFYLDKPLLIDGYDSNIITFNAVSGEETDLGNLNVTINKPFLSLLSFSFKADDNSDSKDIESIVAKDGQKVYLHIKAKGGHKIPTIVISSSAKGELFSETLDDIKLINTSIFVFEATTSSKLEVKIAVSEEGADSINRSKTLLISAKNLPPVISSVRMSNEKISSTEAKGFEVLLGATDPEGQGLKYNWKVTAPLSGVTMSGADQAKIILTTTNLTASSLTLTVDVSDGVNTVSKKISIPVNLSTELVSSINLKPSSTVGVGNEVSLVVVTSDLVSSIQVDWGDGNSSSGKKSKETSFAHSYASEGEYTITIIVVGSNKEKVSHKKVVKISNDYHVPVLEKGLLSIDEDTAGKLDLSKLVTDPDANETYEFIVVKKPVLGSVLIEKNTLIYTPSANANGADVMLIKVFDGTSFSNESDIRIDIKPINDAPKLSNLEKDISLGFTTSIDLKTLVKDPDKNDVHEFKIITNGTLGEGKIENVSTLSYKPAVAGVDKVAIVASDGVALSNECVIVLNIKEVAANIALNGGAFETDQNVKKKFDLLPYLDNPSGLAPVTFKVVQQGALGEGITSGTDLIYTPKADKTGDDKIILIGVVGEKGSEKSTEPATFVIKINKVVVAPVLIDGSMSATQGETATFDLTKLVSNYDANKTYAFGVRSGSEPTEGPHSIEGNKFIYTPKIGSLLTDKTTIYATESGLNSNMVLLTITIAKTVKIPAFTSTPITSGSDGVLYKYSLTASHPDNLPLTFGLKADATWLKLEGNLLVGTPTQADVGSHFITARVTDGQTTVEQIFTIEVKDVNYGPKITTSPPTIGTVGQSYGYKPSAEDPDGDTIVWKIETAPAGLSIDDKTGEINWVPSAGDDNPTKITILAIESGAELKDSQTWLVEINSVSKPVITNFIADDPDDGDKVFSKEDTLVVRFDQTTNTPKVSTKKLLDGVFDFSESIGDDYIGEWVSKSILKITVLDPGSANPGIGTLRIRVNGEGNLKNEAGTSENSTSVSDFITGDWGKAK